MPVNVRSRRERTLLNIDRWRTRSVFDRYAIVDQNDIGSAMKQGPSEQKAADSVQFESKSVAVAKAQIVN